MVTVKGITQFKVTGPTRSASVRIKAAKRAGKKK